MKKLISTFLVLALVLTMFVSAPLSSQALITNPIMGEKVTVLDSSTVTDLANFLKGKDVSSGTATDTTFSYASGAWTTPLKGYTNPLLESSNASVTETNEFEWSFKISGNGAWGKAGFLFNVDTDRAENPTVLNGFSNVSDISNCFAVAFHGAGRNKGGDYADGAGFTITNGVPYDGLRPSAITILVPDAQTGALTPLNAVEYTAEQIKSTYKNYSSDESMVMAGEGGYMNLDAEGIDLHNAQLNFYIRLEGCKLRVSVSQGDTVHVQKDFILPAASLERAPKGDFAISNGGYQSTHSNLSGTGDRTNALKIYKLKINAATTAEPTDNTLIFDSTELDEVGYNWLSKSSNDYAATWNETYQAVSLPKYFTSSKILEQNGYENNDLENFVWQMDYMSTDPVWSSVDFLFHVNDSSTLPTGTETSDDKITKVMGVSSFGAAIGSTANTNAKSEKRDSNALVVGAARYNTDIYRSALYYKDATIGLSTVLSKFALPETYSITRSGTTYGSYFNTNVFYTLRITYKDGNLYVEIWETEKGKDSDTYQTYFYSYSNDQIADSPSGDFAIFCNNPILVKNMKVWRGTETSEFAQNAFDVYEAYKTEYTFDTLPKDLYKAQDNESSFEAVDGTLKVTGGDGNVLYVRGIDGDNNNLGDFILNFDWMNSANYLNFRYDFRMNEDQTNYYALKLAKQGGTITSNVDGTANYIQLSKFTDSVETVLVKVPVAASLVKDRMFSFKLKAINDTIEVYISPVGSSVDIPLFKYTDTESPYTTGLIRIRSTIETLTLDNVQIYDITAYNLAQTIAEGTADVQRGMDAEIEALRLAYLGMHTSQKAKLAATKAALNTAIDTLADIEFAAHDANASGEIDICDLVLLYKSVEAAENLEGIDPLFDGVLDQNDIPKLRKWILSDGGKVNILAIGNSYTQDSMTYAAQIADSLGYDEFCFANMFFPGRSVPNHALMATGEVADYHYELYTKDGMIYEEGVTVREALEEKDWDIIFFQTSPTGAAHNVGYDDLDTLIDYIKGIEGNNVRFMWQNSWAYANHEFPDTFNYNADKINDCNTNFAGETEGVYSQSRMQTMIKNQLVDKLVNGAYAEVIGKDGIIPVGLAIEAARRSDVDFKVGNESFHDMTRDGYHLSLNMGRYIAALTLIRQFTGTDLVYTDGIYNTLRSGTASEEQIKEAISIVNNAFAECNALGAN